MQREFLGMRLSRFTNWRERVVFCLICLVYIAQTVVFFLTLTFVIPEWYSKVLWSEKLDDWMEGR